jgi:phage gp29-like protein
MGTHDIAKRGATPNKPTFQRVSTGSLQERHSSYPGAGLSPGKLSAIFRSADQGDIREQIELYEEMEEKDSHLASILQTRKVAVQRMRYRIQPYTNNSPDREIADFVRAVLAAIDFDQILIAILDALGKGFSVNEILWGERESKVVVKNIEWIHPKRISFSQGEKPRLIEIQSGTIFTPPLWKVIFHRCTLRSGSVVRAGLLRTVAWVYLFKNYALKDWNVFNEVFGIPLRLGRYDASASPEDRESLRRSIASLGSDAAAIISKNTEIEFVEAHGRGSGQENPFMAMAEFCNREMSKAILGQTLTTDVSQATGTYSAAKVHHQVRRDIIQSDADSLASTLRGQLIKPLVGFNFGWDRNLPYLHFYFEEDIDLKAMSETYRNLTDMGVCIPHDHIAEVFGLPRSEVFGGKV